MSCTLFFQKGIVYYVKDPKLSTIYRVPVHGKERHITFDLISCLLQKGKTRSPVRTELPKIGPSASAPPPALPAPPTGASTSLNLQERGGPSLPQQNVSRLIDSSSPKNIILLKKSSYQLIVPYFSTNFKGFCYILLFLK